MTKIIMNGCNGKMGQVITRLVNEDPECEIVAGFDVNDSIENTYPVFTNPEDFTGEADVIIDFSHPSALTNILTYCKKRKMPVILATTGFSDVQKKEFTEASNEIPVFFSANMSNFAHSFIRFYINWVAAMVELVDTRDLKSLDPKRSCGFESRSRHNEKDVS